MCNTDLRLVWKGQIAEAVKWVDEMENKMATKPIQLPMGRW